MTPMPKNLSPQQRLAWRRSMIAGRGPLRSAVLARGPYPAGRNGGTPAHSLSRKLRNGQD